MFIRIVCDREGICLFVTVITSFFLSRAAMFIRIVCDREGICLFVTVITSFFF